jgi:hypothetical protein
MVYNEKAIRKAVRTAVAEYKQKMLGRYTIVDVGGRKWSLEYNVLYWKEDWNDWDFWAGCNSQKDMIEELGSVALQNSHVAVNVALMCEGSTNCETVILMDGTVWKKPSVY